MLPWFPSYSTEGEKGVWDYLYESY